MNFPINRITNRRSFDHVFLTILHIVRNGAKKVLGILPDIVLNCDTKF